MSTGSTIPAQLVALQGGATLRFEPFDTKHLGGSAYTLLLPANMAVDTLRGALSDFRRWLAGQRGVYLVTVRDQSHAQRPALESTGFRRIETTVALYRDLPGLPVRSDTRVSLAVPADEPGCVTLGGNSFVYDRFHRDPNIAKAAADSIKAEWVQNGLRGRADAAFVARVAGRPAGFNLCMVRADGPWIDLIATDANRRREGLGRALVDASIEHYGAKNFPRLGVKTQADNVESLGMYRRCGFVATEEIGVYHLTPSA